MNNLVHQNKEEQQDNTIVGWMERARPNIEAVLPPNITADRFIRTVANAATHNPQLMKADRSTLYLSVMTAAVLGLELDPSIGQAYLVPFKGKVQCIPGYKGYIRLAEYSGYIVQGNAVRANDVFEYELGLEPKLRHVPAAGTIEDRGDIVFTYATARHKDNPPVFRVVDVKQIEKIRNRSSGYKAYKSGRISETPWSSDYEAMAVKTAVRALAPQLPLNVQRAHALENAYDTGDFAYINTEDKTLITPSQIQDDGATSEQPTATEILGSNND